MVEWDEIEMVLLDMDGTLLDLYFDNYFWQEYLPVKWGTLHDLDPADAKARLAPQFKSKAGTLSWYCLDYWTQQLNIDVLALKADLEHLIAIRPYAEEFLTFLKGTGKQIVMATNAHQKLIEMKMEKTGIDRYFHQIFCAHGLGAPKEEVDFWHRLNQACPFVPETTLLIDDNLNVLRSARDYGIRHLLTIAQPDSHVPERQVDEFVAVKSFQSLF